MASSTTGRFLARDIPPELSLIICSNLCQKELYNLSLVARGHNVIVKQPMWKHINFNKIRSGNAFRLADQIMKHDSNADSIQSISLNIGPLPGRAGMPRDMGDGSIFQPWIHEIFGTSPQDPPPSTASEEKVWDCRQEFLGALTAMDSDAGAIATVIIKATKVTALEFLSESDSTQRTVLRLLQLWWESRLDVQPFLKLTSLRTKLLPGNVLPPLPSLKHVDIQNLQQDTDCGLRQSLGSLESISYCNSEDGKQQMSTLLQLGALPKLKCLTIVDEQHVDCPSSAISSFIQQLSEHAPSLKELSLDLFYNSLDPADFTSLQIPMLSQPERALRLLPKLASLTIHRDYIISRDSDLPNLGQISTLVPHTLKSLTLTGLDERDLEGIEPQRDLTVGVMSFLALKFDGDQVEAVYDPAGSLETFRRQSWFILQNMAGRLKTNGIEFKVYGRNIGGYPFASEHQWI